MLCSKCQAENRNQARFCSQCGAAMALACPRCGTELLPDARFCDACGAAVDGVSPVATELKATALADALQRLVPKQFAERLLATRGQVGPERRTVTILFSDVRGSTQMAETLDPEDVADIMDGAFDVLIEPVYRYEGTLARLMGDGILAFFGAPIAHEDDPERALRAALDIIEGAKEYAARLERERGIAGFDVRVGINTGLVVVGEVGSDLRVEYTAMGDAINLAARMESAAEPGTVLITGETHRAVAPLFETEALGPIRVKGRVEPVNAYRVVAPKPAPGKMRGIIGLDSRLVGRDAEFRRLREAVERLQTGVGGIVTLMGEAGLGKSRLVAELRNAAPVSGVRWVEGRCLSYGTSVAYSLWLDVLRGFLCVTPDMPPADVRERLWEQLQALCPERSENVYPYLARVMSLPLDAEAEAIVGGLDAEEQKAGTFRAIATLVESAARQTPLVLVCEDLHWADPTSLELLERLLALTDRAALLFICVFRPEKEHGCWRIREIAARTYRHRHTDLEIAPLSTDESETLVANLLRVGDLPYGLKERILDVAEGNPFYVEEVIRSLMDSGAVVRDETAGRWEVTEGAFAAAIPDTLHGVLMARIDRLQEEAKRVLQVASVIGRIFHRRVLEAIVQEERSLDEHLLVLQREEMIRERARLPEPEYAFKHHLTQESVYSSLLKKERRVLHHRVAETLERLYADRIEEYVEVLARHWDCAEEPEKATEYLLRAGDRARRLGASLEAVDFYRMAVEKAAGLPASQRAAELRRIHEQLGDVLLLNLSRHAEALAQYESFLALAESGESAARGARKIAMVHLLWGRAEEAQAWYETALEKVASSPLCAEASRIQCGLAHLLVSMGRLDEAEEHALTGLEIARGLGDAGVLADAYKAVGTIAYYRDDLKTACEHFEHVLSLYRQLGDLPRIAQTCNNVGEICRMLGQMPRSLQYLDEGLEMARRIGDMRDEAHLLSTKADLFLDQGRFPEAVSLLERALPLAEESGVTFGIIEVHLLLGAAYEGVGRLEDARRHLKVADEVSQEKQHWHLLSRILMALACVEAALGEFDEAQKLVQKAVDTAGPEPSDVFLGAAQRCYGVVHAGRGQWSEAVAHLERSLEHLGRTRLAAEIGRTRLHLGEAYASRGKEGDRQRACEALLAAQAIFRQIEAQGYLSQVEARLEEMGCSL